MGDYDDYGCAQERAFHEARETGQDWCVVSDDDDGTYLVVTDAEAQRFAEDDRYRIIYAARPWRVTHDGEPDETGVTEVYAGRMEWGEK